MQPPNPLTGKEKADISAGLSSEELFPDGKWKDEAIFDLLVVWKLINELKSRFMKGLITKLEIETQIRQLLNQTRVCQSNSEISGGKNLIS